MTTRITALLALMLALAACGGNPFVTAPVDPVEPVDPVDPDPTTDPTAPVVVPGVLKDAIQSVSFTPGATPSDSTLQIAITGLDTTPVVATWARRPSMDINGYTAFAVQEDSLDRLFVGLAATSADGSVSAVVAGDGGQFNKVYNGSDYSRTGAYTPPDATGSGPATGQVSYTGNYVGLLNGGGDGSELLPVPGGTDPDLLPSQAARVTGKGFINANFADNTVNGAIYDRVIVDTGFGLESIVLVPTAILANGTFVGTDMVESPKTATGGGDAIGSYGGVFGGTDAAGVAGAVTLTRVNDALGEEIEDALEQGVFVMNQCGLPTSPVDPLCAGVAP